MSSWRMPKKGFTSVSQVMSGSGSADTHQVEYAVSNRATCRSGRGACRLPIAKGDLRYGREYDMGDRTAIEWAHWLCILPYVLNQMKTQGVERLRGFSKLTPDDRARVRRDIETGRISATESSAAISNVSSLQAGPSLTNETRKRKASLSDDNVNSVPSATRITAEGDVEDVEAPPEEEQDEVYVAYSTQVVGVQYYTGMVGTGELVSIVREPNNRFDRNAIRVMNASGNQVGHIPRGVAALLAPLMDAGRVSVEGIMAKGNLTGRFTQNLSITLNICGPSDLAKRAQLEPLLRWATPGQRGFNVSDVPTSDRSAPSGAGQSLQRAGPSGSGGQLSAADRARLVAQQEAAQKALELSRMIAGLSKVDDTARRSSLLDAMCGEDLLSLPLFEEPPSRVRGNMKTDLLKHQSQGLRWCIGKENTQLPETPEDKPVQFWQLQKNVAQSYYYNIATKTPQMAAPSLGRGAIMADSMGLGKTLTMLATIVQTLNDPMTDGFSTSTLILVPLSVLSSWTTQIEEHVVDGILRSHVYHGEGRSIKAKDMAKYDVVITTYDMVSQDWKVPADGRQPAKKKSKVDGGLFGVKWKRVILDEGHNIRNPKTKTAKAICDLEAAIRWVVTGTPIINSPNDLGSLLTFLKVCSPLDQHDFFNRLLVRPLGKGSPEAADLLKGVMSSVCLRRTKEMRDEDGNTLVALPPVEVTVVKVTLNEDERQLYDDVFAESQKHFVSLMRGDTATLQTTGELPMAANVLSMLTRLRQLALHTSLIPDGYLEELRASSKSREGSPPRQELDEALIPTIQARLSKAIQDSEECSICFDLLRDPRILPCQHYYCLECIREVITRQHMCPMDRRPCSAKDLIALSSGADEMITLDIAENTASKRVPPSSKISHLTSLLRLIPATEKSLVFSQFTSFLDLIAHHLDDEGIPYIRFDGSMPQKRRAEALRQFSVPLPDPNETDSETDYEQEIPSRSRTKSKGKGKAVAMPVSRRNPVVMLISLKAGALGLNLTVASRVFLMDPWWQSAIELQAIDRVNRIGQTKDVHVYCMVAENTVEARVLAIQDRKELLIQQAFSGTRRSETHRQKKEARLNDLVELFEANILKKA